MRIQTIEISGWMPFAGSFTLSLPAGPIAVIGTHAGDVRRSNRAGKTSLLEAITWCLFGWHRKRLDDAVINRSVQECVVSIRLGDIRVTRSRKRGSSTKLIVTMFEGGESVMTLTGEAAQNAIAEAVGLGLDDYFATSCFRQGDVESIVSQSSGDRLVLVSEWLQQSKWFDAKKLQAAKTNQAETRLAEKRAALETAASYLVAEDVRSTMIVRSRELAKQGGEIDVEIQAVSNKLADSSKALTQLNAHRELKGLRLRAVELRRRLEGRAPFDARTKEAAEQVASARAEAITLKDGLTELQNIRRSGFDGVCPITCEQCPAAEHVNDVVQTASALFDERSRAYEAQRQAVERATAEHAAASADSQAFNTLAATFQSVTDRGRQLSSTITMTEEEAVAVPAPSALQIELTELRERMAETLKEATTIESSLLNAKRADERYVTLQQEAAAAEQSAVASRLALKAISSVPAKIAAQQLGELELEANALLEGTGVSLRFSWARELADKAPQCEECGFIYPSKRGDACPTCKAVRGKKRAQELELLCDDGSGAEEDIRFNSGGTRAIVGSSIRLAASAMLRRLRSSRAAWAIVDEPFGSLDLENREQLARTFMGMLSSVGLEQALVVSHDAALLSALPNRIVVDKDGSSSTVRVE